MEAKIINDLLYNNPLSLLKEMYKYDPEGVSTNILTNSESQSFIKQFVARHKKTSYYDGNSSFINSFLTFCFELGYDPMRIATYNPYLNEWGKEKSDYYDDRKYAEITSLWFDLSDENQVLILDKIGQKNVQQLVSQGFNFLHIAFKAGHLNTIEKLVAFGLDFNRLDLHGKNVKYYAENKSSTFDLYLKLNPEINESEKFPELREWFVETIKDISTYKYTKTDQVKAITNWLIGKWSTFTLEEKQEIYSLSFGTTVKDIQQIVSNLGEDKKNLLSVKYPVWLSLENCKVKQFALSAVKNISPYSYNPEKDIYFVENLAQMFKNFGIKDILNVSPIKPENQALISLAKSYFNYKDIWIMPFEDGEPLFHIMAKRKNEVFNQFSNTWLDVKNSNDLLTYKPKPEHTKISNSGEISYAYNIEKSDKSGGIFSNVVTVPFQQIYSISDKEILYSTWFYKDKNDKYTFEYFFENHYKSLTRSFFPSVFENLNTKMKTYNDFSKSNILLPQVVIKNFETLYEQDIKKLYPPEIIFRLIESSTKIHYKMCEDVALFWECKPENMVNLIRSCYNILNLPEYKDIYKFPQIQLHPKMQEHDKSLYHDFSSHILDQKLNRDLVEKLDSKKLKI